jgi:HPt (histidine-containing phosphotransfer) domain-containing protein
MGLTLPIVAVTANALEDDRQRAIDVGMDAHLAKPIDVDRMVATLNGLTAGGDARERQARARSGDGGAEQALPADIPGIDLRATLPRFGGNFAGFVALFKRFESSQGGTLDEVRMLLRGADRSGARQLVHRLRGVAANLGAAELAALALDFEQALRSASDAELLMRLAQLDAAMRTVLDAARELQAPPTGAPAGAPGMPQPELETALADLLALLQNNNLKAMAAFEALRAALGAQLAPAGLAALGEAIDTLSFAAAAGLVQDLMTRKDSA